MRRGRWRRSAAPSCRLGVRGVQLVLQTSHLRLERAHLRIQRVAFGRFRAALLRGQLPQRARAPGLAPSRQMRAVQPLAAKPPTHLAAPRAALRLLQDLQPLNWRRFGLATTSGSGVGLARPALGGSSLRSSTPGPEGKPHSMSSRLSLRSSVFTSTALQKFQRLLVSQSCWQRGSRGRHLGPIHSRCAIGAGREPHRPAGPHGSFGAPRSPLYRRRTVAHGSTQSRSGSVQPESAATRYIRPG